MDEPKRCAWACGKGEAYLRYHDEEWGVPLTDDNSLYALFLLETFQAGLSWRTILEKREAFRSAFDGFDAGKIARYDEEKIRALLQNAGVIRCRRKIEAAIRNAGVFLAIQGEFGSFARYLWGFTNGKVVVNTTNAFPTRTALSDRVSEDLYARGMRYVGSVTIYSYLQAAGVVNDHETTCFRHPISNGSEA